jgi:chemotaxis protein CheX
MAEDLVAAFAQAAKRTFKDMFGIEAAESGSRELAGSEGHAWDLTGLVGIAGQAQGVVAIRLPQALVASLLASSGVAAGGAEERRQLEGGLVGEMANIMAGAAVSAMSELQIDIAPPVIVRGVNHQIGWPNIAPVVAVSFESSAGGFEVDVCARH